MESSNSEYPCHINPELSIEQFIPDHIFIYLKAGSITINDRLNTYIIQPGEFCLAKRNHLARYMKNPDRNGKLEAISIVFKRDFLKSFLKEYKEITQQQFPDNDFNDPGKIDLEDFMNKNYCFNVSLERFAYLSGRSLTAFKQDFNKIFVMPPGRWLLNKRLQEAHHLITDKKRRPSAVYLELGFEDLSHFSFAFKKLFGVSPSQLL